ncbi:YybH family protein [Ekhidna sp. To15]|uniref:YybH family protein n=1 Tax=Ekhidna sp. To15 TaxID=3395267 RepID=UPI003F51B20A
MKALTFILLLGVFSQLSAQFISSEDSLQIVQQVEDWNKAWKIKDPVLAAKWYSDDADFTNAFGFSMIGKQAIEKYLTRVFNMDFVMAGDSEQTSLKLKYISEKTILVVSTISRKGQKLNDNTELGPRLTTHHRLFQNNGEWTIVAHLISDARSIETNKH